jgi:polyisoprenoid-binding protein YceI
MGAWTFDPMHTQVEFAAKHLGMMTVRGNFTEVLGSGDIDAENLENSTVELAITTASIQTHNARRDNDLRASAFLDVEHYPTITFRSRTIEPGGSDNYQVTGELTIKGVTREVSFNLVRYGEFNDPDTMGHRVAYAADGEINRKDFGMNFEMMADGKLIVGNEIKLHIEGELVETADVQNPVKAKQSA